MKKIAVFLIIILVNVTLAFAGDVTSTRAIKEFFKEHTKLNIAGDSVKSYKATLNRLSRQVIKRAEELAKKDKRKTVLQRDIDQASEEIFRQAPMTVSELMEKIKQLAIIELVEFNKKIKTYVEKLLENNKK